MKKFCKWIIFSTFIAGITLGLSAYWKEAHDRYYLAHRLYYTITSTLTLAIDSYLVKSLLVIIPLGILFGLFLKSRGVMKFVTAVILGVGAVYTFVWSAQDELVSGFIRSHGWDNFLAGCNEVTSGVSELFSLSTLKSALRVYPLSSALGILLIAGLSILVFRLQREWFPKQPSSALIPVESSPTDKHICSGRPAGFKPRLETIIVAMVLVVLAINLTAGAFWLRNYRNLKSRPNVVLIMADAVRADHLGCYGYYRNTTPSLDALAKDGVIFQHCRSQASWTTWSVASFMTSQYPQSLDLGEWDAPRSVPRNVLTMAEALHELGYSTNAVVSNPNAGANLNFNQGFDSFHQSGGLLRVTSPGVLKKALTTLKDQKDRRFFLFTLFVDPHAPYIKHKGYDFDPEYRGKIGNSWETEAIGNGKDPVPTADLKHIEALYDSEIAYTDNHIGRLIDSLKKEGLYDNTMIIFLSDHGEQFMDHGGFGHVMTLYHELIRVPLIIKLPNERKHEVANGAFALVNLLPSVLKEVHAGNFDNHFQGDTVNLRDPGSERMVFSATNCQGIDQLRSTIDNEYKLVKNLTTGREELYNIHTDKQETKNLVKSNPSIANRLRAEILRHENQVMAFKPVERPTTARKSTLDPEEHLKLRSLGYAN